MAQVVVFGASGYAGGHIVGELKKRGHAVKGVSRQGGDGTEVGDATQAEEVRRLVEDAEVVVLALRAHENGQEPLAQAVANLIRSDVARFGVVGGAGSLIGSDGVRVADSPGFPEVARPEAEAQARVLEQLRLAKADVDWFYVSPTAMFGARAEPVQPRGTYRTLADELVVDDEGKSHIAAEDFARAFVDEIENPTHSRQRFSVGY